MENECILCGVELEPDDNELCRHCAEDDEKHYKADREREER